MSTDKLYNPQEYLNVEPYQCRWNEHPQKVHGTLEKIAFIRDGCSTRTIAVVCGNPYMISYYGSCYYASRWFCNPGDNVELKKHIRDTGRCKIFHLLTD